MKKVIFIYSGSRKKLIEDIKSGLSPDTQLYGMNHIDNSLIGVSVKEFSDTIWYKIFGEKIDFRIKHFLMFFYTKENDTIFGSSLLYMTFLKKIFFSKRKLILLNISLNRYLDLYINKNYFLYKISQFFIKEIDLIVSLSNFQMNQLMVKHKIPASKLLYIPLGVDIKFYNPVFENRKKYILSVGRDNGRDYGTFIQVAKKMPDTEFHLVLSERNLKGINDLPTNVKVFLDIPFSVLKGKYEEAFVLLLITHPDGFSDGSDCSGQTVLLDAFASGLPVIATQKAYLSDYGKDGIDLLLVRPYDSDQIMSSISKIDEIGISMAKNARSKVETNFSTEEMGNNLTNLFLK